MIIVIPTLFVVPYLASLSEPITESEKLKTFSLTDPTAVFLQLLGIIPAHILTIFLAWVVVTRRRKYDFRKTLGWSGGGYKVWLSYPVILISFYIVAYFTAKFFPPQETDLDRMMQSSRSVIYLIALIATFAAPFVEEVVYRGILYSALQRKFGIITAFIVASVLFTAVHVPQYLDSPSTLFLLLLLSFTLTAIRIKTDNLLPCIIMHTIFNGFQLVILILEPLMPKPEVQQQAATLFHLLK